MLIASSHRDMGMSEGLYSLNPNSCRTDLPCIFRTLTLVASLLVLRPCVASLAVPEYRYTVLAIQVPHLVSGHSVSYITSEAVHLSRKRERCTKSISKWLGKPGSMALITIEQVFTSIYWPVELFVPR